MSNSRLQVTIENMTMVGSGWLRNFECEWADRENSQPGIDPTGQWAYSREGMLRIENGTNITVSGCELLAAGTSAVWMEHHAQHCVVENNWIEHVRGVSSQFGIQGARSLEVLGTWAPNSNYARHFTVLGVVSPLAFLPSSLAGCRRRRRQ